MNPEKKEVVAEVDGLFQFVITVSIFFLAIIDLLFGSSGLTTDQSSNTQLTWSLLVGALLIAYLLFKYFKDNISEVANDFISSLLKTEILLFAIEVIFLGLYKNNIPTLLGRVEFVACLYLLPIIAGIVFVVCLVESIKFLIKKK